MKYFKIPILLLALFAFAACSDDDDDTVELVGNWIKRSDFEGVARSEASSFVIGNKGYVGMGYNGKSRLIDLWEYNSEKEYWTQKADFPGTARSSAVSFAIGTNGYIATGTDGENYLKDIWAYNQETNTWIKKGDFGGTARSDAVAFSIDNKGYLGTGYDGNHLKDFWIYNPDADTWTQTVSVGGSKRTAASAFVIDGKAYVFGGINNGSYVTDFWMFDPQAEKWTEKHALKDVSDEEYDNDYAIARTYGSAFTINSKGYITLGLNSSILYNTWEYDPTTDIWVQKSSFEGTPRIGAVVLSFGNMAFITTGRSSSYRFDDCWEFKPNDEADEND